MTGETRVWTFLDKSAWGEGPWVDEPDKVQWIDPATGLDCLAVRNPAGAWCGYVGVPAGHPAFGKDYGDVGADVHGGLTFAGPCNEEPRTKEEVDHGWGPLPWLPDADVGAWRICHAQEPGRPEVHWFGFDCLHAWDFGPQMHAMLVTLDARRGAPLAAAMRRNEVYRDLGYVRAECAGLARQLAAMEPGR